MSTPGGYSAGTIFLQVVPSFRNFHEALRREARVANQAWANAQERARNQEAERDRAAAERRGRDSGGAYSRGLTNALKNAAKSLPEITLRADASDVEQALTQIKARLQTLGDSKFEIGADSREAVREIRRLERELAQIATQSADPEIVVDAAGAYAELKAFREQFRDIERARADVQVDVDTGRARAKLRDLKRQLDNIERNQNALRAFSGLTLGVATLLPLVVPAAVAAAGALAAIGPAAVVGAGGLGVLIAGFSGLSDAVKGLEDVANDGAKQTRDIARAQRAAAKSVRDAEQSLTRARQDAAEGAEDSARRVADAQQRQGEVAEQNAKRMRDALEDQRRAEETLSDAQEDARRAQRDLTQARKDAQDQLEDLALRVRGGALAERQAVIDLFEAQVAYNAAQSDGAATTLDREEAAIALEQARLRLEQQRLDNGRLAEEQADAQRRGVEGSALVVQATERVADANDRVGDAQRGAAAAAEAVAQTQRDGARAAAEAAEAVADAMRAQSRAAQDGALAIRDAQENVAAAQLNYADSLERTGAAQERLNTAMSKLGPAGQSFARFLFAEVLPGLRDMRAAIQEGLLPGVTDGLRILFGTYGPQLTAFLGLLGEVFGDIFRDIGEALTQPVWREFFATMAEYAPVFLRSMAQLGGGLLTVLAQLLTAFAPLTDDFLNALIRGAEAMSAFLASTEGQAALQGFMEAVREYGPDVAAFLGALVSAVVNIGKALAPYADKLLQVFTGVLDLIAGMDPTTLGTILVSIILLTIAVQTILGVASIVATIGAAIAATSTPILGTIALVVIGIAALVAAFILAYNSSETFRDIVKASLEVLGKAWDFIWGSVIKPVLDAFIGTLRFLGDVVYSVLDFIVKLFQATFRKVGEAWDAFSQTGAGKALIEFFDKYVQPAWEKFLDFVSFLWDSIKQTFKDGVFLVVETVLNDGLIDPFNKLAGLVGSKPIPRIALPASFGQQDGESAADMAKRNARRRFATGGMVGGYSPTATADNIPAWLTAGEYVLPVRAVQNLRARFGDDFLEALRRGMPGYASGGLVGFGRELQRRGFRVSEHPAFGGVAPVHKGRGHYEGRAIDVNFGPGGESDVEKRAIDAILPLAKQYGLNVIWRTKGHYNHAHFEQGGKSILGKVGEFAGNLLDNLVSKPAEALLGKVSGALGRIGDHPLGGLLKGVVRKVAGMLGNALGLDLAETGEFGTDIPEGGAVRDIVRSAAQARGWDKGAHWNALESIIQRESGFNPNAQNPSSSAYGLFQFLNGTWASTGFTKSSDPAVQAAAGMAYIAQRYGDPRRAKQFWDKNGWYSEGGYVSEDGGGDPPTLYDTGGWLQPGLTTVLNATGRPEPVFTSEQWDMIRRGGGVGGGGGTTIEINTQTVSTAADIAHEVLFANRQIRRGGVHATRKAP